MRKGMHSTLAMAGALFLLMILSAPTEAMGQGGYPKGWKHAGASAAASESEGFARVLGERPSGWYAKGFGMALWQQDSDIRDNTGFAPEIEQWGTEFSFDIGFGGGVSVGYTFADFPVSLELEYAYRTAETDAYSVTIDGISGSGSVEGDFAVHAIMFNALFDTPIGESRFGLYGGGGVGIAVSEADLDSINGIALPIVSDDDTTFAWQVMGGVTFDVSARAQLYTGVRYFDAGDVDFELLGGENSSLSWEFGLRIYF